MNWKGCDNMRLKDFLKTVKGNDFELYNDYEELLFTTMGYCYKPISLLAYSKHEVDLVECCVKDCKPFLRIYIIEKEI